MALSTRKKNQIIADWKAGRFQSYYAIAKHYKINEKTAKKILENIPHENAYIVEVCSIAEEAIKSVKNPVELNAVENAVKERLKVHEITHDILDGISKLTKGGKAQKVVTESEGGGSNSAKVIDYDLQADDYKKLADAVDKVSVTQGINQRHANTNLQVNTQVNNETNIQNIEEFYET